MYSELNEYSNASQAVLGGIHYLLKQKVYQVESKGPIGSHREPYGTIGSNREISVSESVCDSDCEFRTH